MNRIAKPEREYHSELRAEQAQATRTRILDATMRVMAEGLAGVTIPAVAREAGVSVPTVYRHFRTKRELLAGLQPHLQRRARLHEVALPDSIGEFRDSLVEMLGRMDSLDDLARAALASPAADEVRRVHFPNRFGLIRRIADAIAAGQSTADRERIARLLLILTSSSALRVWRDHLGASVDELADDIDWVVKAAIAASGAEQPA
jgi:AcrR family transcriptional regulator